MLSRKLLSNLKFLRCFTTNTSIDKNEVEFFSRLSSEWWNETGTFKPLHSYNKLRVPFIREGLIQNGVVDLKYLNTSKVLKGLRILDVGCGGGILTESLSRLGADVTGLDADNEAIKAAENHLKVSNIEGLSYSASSVEHHAIENEEIYDAVVASEILEHVINKDSFIENCLKCLKPKGLIFFTTINKTIIADILGIQIAECIGLVPEGTHEIDKFIHPHELQRILEKCELDSKLGNFVFNGDHFCVPITSQSAVCQMHLNFIKCCQITNKIIFGLTGSSICEHNNRTLVDCFSFLVSS